MTLVSGCTRCSPGCDNCWALGMEERFNKPSDIITYYDRLPRFEKKKPTVYSIWNDLFHEYVSEDFRYEAYKAMILNKQHTYLILTKREKEMAEFFSPKNCFTLPTFEGIWHGLTICNQQEADEKIPIFLQVPGKKFLSVEPMLGLIDITKWLPQMVYNPGKTTPERETFMVIDAVILGGETGAKARPLKLEWASKIAEQCKAAGVPLFTKALTINSKPDHNIEDWPKELRIRELAW